MIRRPPRSTLFPTRRSSDLAAMAFDASDRERATRRADCAFWLHLLAAPLIVHSLIWLVSPDRKSTRLNSSHVEISYAVFCLKKKKKNSDIVPYERREWFYSS